jgi:hypothetical protein
LDFIFFGIPDKDIDWPGLQVGFGKRQVSFRSSRPDDMHTVPGILFSNFFGVGIQAGAAARTNWTTISKPGDWAIFIPQKF